MEETWNEPRKKFRRNCELDRNCEVNEKEIMKNTMNGLEKNRGRKIRKKLRRNWAETVKGRNCFCIGLFRPQKYHMKVLLKVQNIIIKIINKLQL